MTLLSGQRTLNDPTGAKGTFVPLAKADLSHDAPALGLYFPEAHASGSTTAGVGEAVTAASAAKGTVWLSATYTITATVVLASDVTFAGPGKIVGNFATGTQAMIKNDWTNGNSNIALRGITIDRTGTNSQHGVLLNGITNLDIEGCTFIGPASVTSGSLSVSGVGPPTRLRSTGVRIRGNRFTLSDNFAVQIGYVRNAVVTGNTFDDCFREAIGVEPITGDIAENVLISGNSVSTSTVGGGTQTGLIISTESSGGTVSGVGITGNILEGYSVTAGQAMPGVMVLGGTGISVTANTIKGVPGNGIMIGNSLNPVVGATVANNHIESCGAGGSGYGIFLGYTTGSHITGNYVKGANHTASLTEATGSSGNWVTNNNLLDTTAYTSAPTGSYYISNKTAATDPSLLYPMTRHGFVGGQTNLAVAVGASATAVASIRSANDYTGNTSNYGGLVLVQARLQDFSSTNTATYLLLISKAGANSVCNLVSSGGLTSGSSGTWPSFTFALDTTNNKITATPVGSTSTATSWQFHFTSFGDLVVSAP